MTETAEQITDYMPLYSCDHCAPTSGATLPIGYVDEIWPTIGGGGFRRMSCFACRGTVTPFDRDDPRWRPSQRRVVIAEPECMEE